jgi:predicted enzyme related to lactoylglutathione lyase
MCHLKTGSQSVEVLFSCDRPHMTLKLSHCNLRVRDLDEALAFYRDAIGLEVRLDMPMGAGRWLTVGPAGQPDLEIILEPTSVATNPEDEETLRSLIERYVLQTLIFVTDDCDATFARVKAAGAEVAQEPTNQPYGVRDCSFRDPSGNQVRFSQPLGRER